MKWLLSLTPIATLALTLSGCSSHTGHQDTGHETHKHDPHADHGHKQDEAKLLVRTDPAEPAAMKPAALKLMIHAADGRMLKDFAVVHEKKVHLIVVRDGLDTFAHLHPEIDEAGNITAAYTFPSGGTYWLYADYQPAGGKATTATAAVKVAGDAPAPPALKPDVPGTVKGDGLDAKVSISGVKAGGEGTIRFELTDFAGKPVADLQPYMGAMGHLVVLSQDGTTYVHAHPADGQKAGTNVVAFGTHFPQAGLYKGWGQFKRQGRVHVVPFVLRVE